MEQGGRCPRRHRWLIDGLLIAAVLALLVPMAATTARADLAAPTGLAPYSTATTAVAVSWNPVAGAPQYRVQYSTSSSMAHPVYKRIRGTQADITGLKPATTYYVKVRVIDDAGANLSGYSPAITVTTRTAGDFGTLAPLAVRATSTAASSVTLAWTSRGTGVRYRVQYAATSSMSGAQYARTTTAGATISGLKPATSYWFRVRALSSSGATLSAYTPAIRATTLKAGYASPSGLTITSSSRTALAVRWNAVAGAPKYRIQYSTSATMSKASYVRVSGTSTELTGLRTGTTYYLKVRVINADGANLGPYSAAVKTATRSSTGYPYLAPSGQVATDLSGVGATLGWAPRAAGLRYQVRYSTDASMAGARTATATSTSAPISDLQALTTYYWAVRVVDANGKALSDYSQPATVKTLQATTPLRVVSYNVKCANCFSALPEELPWSQRRDTLVAAVRAQTPDVIGFQEASQGWLKDDLGKAINLSQFEDLEKRLGAPYSLVNRARNNCVNSSTPTGCVYKDQGASQGTKIVYNTDTLELVKAGSKRLSSIDTTQNARYVAWAIFRKKATGATFFFADTHLEPMADAVGSTNYYQLRQKQAGEMVAAIAANNPKKLPVVAVGDFNSSKWTVPTNAPYDVFQAAGYVDPLGNAYNSTRTATGATVEKRINTTYNSYNGYSRLAPNRPTWINGTYIDYIFTSKMRVAEYENVVNVDAAGNFVGVIPSDHNMQRATVFLPVG